ncbi:MAG: hypothetical protein JXR97_09650 [Planctomycetes bacterium]|nr:hypothetical protein [Planctomycetota bacterium]
MRLFIFALIFLNSVGFAAESVWKLSPINGNKEKGWAEDENWTHAKKNPLSDNGAEWTLAVQEEKNPDLTAKYALMTEGSYVDYNHVWQFGPKAKDPAQKYMGNILSTRPDDKTAQSSRSSAILFRAPKSGSFSVTIKGTIAVQNPSAGHARITIYTLNKKRDKAEELAVFNLNKKAEGAFGNFPDNFAFDKKIKLKKGEEFALRIQTVNPGNASAGTASVKLEEFRLATK